MYPKDKKTAAMMSETVRDVLADDDLFNAIMENSDRKPVYLDMMPRKNGITAIVIAQMLKAMGGDTQAFTALSRYGFGEKVQMDVSDFYKTDQINIHVIDPEPLDEGEIIDPAEIGEQAHDAISKLLDEGEQDGEQEVGGTEQKAAGLGE